MGYGQLRIKDSELSRKIAAAIIDSGVCETNLLGKPAESIELYDNLISYHNINFSFENEENEVLPKIESVIRSVVARELEPNEETLDRVNQVFDFFDTIDRKLDVNYVVAKPDFSGELQFNTANISSRKVVDKEVVVKNLANATGNSSVNHGYYLGVFVEDGKSLSDVLNKAQGVVKKAPNISKKEDLRKDRERDFGTVSSTKCRTTSKIFDELGEQIKTPEEIAEEDSKKDINIPDNTVGDSIPVDPWELL